MGTFFTEDSLSGLSGSTASNRREGEILEERLFFSFLLKTSIKKQVFDSSKRYVT